MGREGQSQWGGSADSGEDQTDSGEDQTEQLDGDGFANAEA